MGVPISTRSCGGSASVGRGGSLCAGACAMVTAVIVWPPPEPLRRVWPGGGRGCGASSRRVRPLVAVPWGAGSRTRASASRASRARARSGRPSQPGGARPHLAPVGGAPRADAARGAPARAWPQCAPPGAGRRQRWARRPGGTARRGRACASTGAAAHADLGSRARDRSRGRGRPRAAGTSPLVCRPARGRNGERRV